jgi:hypothetical protein
MAAFLLRNSGGGNGELSNVLQPHAAQPNYQWYETTYTTAGAQEWVYCPDINPISVTLTPSGSTAQIEATDSPPSVVASGSPNVVTWSAGPVTAATTALLQGFTAFRVNITVGTNAKLSARA